MTRDEVMLKIDRLLQACEVIAPRRDGDMPQKTAAAASAAAQLVSDYLRAVTKGA